MLNKAARQLFARHRCPGVDDFAALGPELAAAVRLPPGTRKITRLMLDGVPQRAIFASAQVARLDQPVTVLSILPVQSELGALEVAAQADLVRVLTHEIMNSLTPVTSLARSGAGNGRAAAKREGPSGRGADRDRDRRPPRRGHLRFVESYREFAQAPDVHRRTFQAKPWAEEILRLALANAGERRSMRGWTSSRQRSTSTPIRSCSPRRCSTCCAMRSARPPSPTSRSSCLASARERSGQFRIEVRDNGPGIPEDRRDDIFLPFYTTHKGGSGVGLSFARQVALAHGGSIAALDAAEGGATLRLIV